MIVAILAHRSFNTHWRIKGVILGQHNTDKTTLPPESTQVSAYTTNSFFSTKPREIGTAGWIRENRVLPIQLNPVQYNPVSGTVKFYHQLVVEVQFNKFGNAPAAVQGFPRPESAVYEKMFGNLLINPQTAKQWRSPVLNAGPRNASPKTQSLTQHTAPFSAPSAPTITAPRVIKYISLIQVCTA